MTAVCRFCNQEFANSQAVRAHLKGCDRYRSRRNNASRASGGDALGKMRSLGNSLGTALEFPGNPDHQDFDCDNLHEDDQGTASVQADTRDDRTIHTSVERVPLTLEHHETASRRRREIIQEVKHWVINERGPVLWCSSETKADALQAIERALVELEVEDLPREELVTIARGVRDRLYRDAERTEKADRDAELRTCKHTQELTERKYRLIQQGKEYAERELNAVDELNGLDQLRIKMRVERELQSIDGDEYWSEIEDLVEDIFASEGIEEDGIDDEEET